MTQNKRIIAITGGIGSGKSTLLQLLTDYGDVLSCDAINGEMLTDSNYLDRLKTVFPEAFTPTFNKRKMAEIIFSDRKKREQLNSIAHPEIMKRMLEKIKECQNGVVFVEVPLLAGTGFDRYFSEIIVVKSNDEIRSDRLQRRDDISATDAQNKMNGQKGEYLFPDAKVYTVKNDGDLDALKRERDRLIKQLLLEK